MPAKLLKLRGFAGGRIHDERGRELASSDAKSVIFANSEKGYVTIHVTESAVPHCGILAVMPRRAKARGFGTDLVEGMKLVLAHERGTVALDQVWPKPIDVKAIRKRVKMSQAEFSRAYGISKRALQEWEQGGRQPDSAARAYLTVIAKEPAVVRRALGKE